MGGQLISERQVGEAWADRRLSPADAAVVAALPGSVQQIMERTGLTKSAVKNALQRLRVDRVATPSADQVWRSTEGAR